MQLSRAQLRRLRLRAQGLSGLRMATPTAVVERLVGVQAQEETAARLAIRARSVGLTAAAVDEARVGQRAIVYTWAMRGTLHFVATRDLGWLLGLLGPRFVSQGQRRRRQLGIDGETGRAAMTFITSILAAEGAQTREGLRERLAGQGIPSEGQAAYHLIGRAALEGILCIGAPHQGEATYVSLAEWLDVKPGPEEDEDALVQLARRYLAGYGPAGAEDFAGWSGVSLRAARAAFGGLQGSVLPAQAGEAEVWMLPEQASWLEQAAEQGPQVRLLPGYDAYLLGYRDRALVITAEHARRLHPGGGVIRPALLVDGVVRGVWRLARRGGIAAVSVEAFERLDEKIGPAIEAEAADVGRFLGLAITLAVEPPGN